MDNVFRGIHRLDAVQTDRGVQPVMPLTASHTDTVLSADVKARVNNRRKSADFAIRIHLRPQNVIDCSTAHLEQ